MRRSEFDLYYLLLLGRAVALCAVVATLIWYFTPTSLLGLGWLFLMWQVLAPAKIAEVRIEPHAFHERLIIVAAGLDLRVYSNGYFVRPANNLSRALAGSVFLQVPSFGAVQICGPRYQVNRLLRRGLVAALCSADCPHVSCAPCKARFNPAGPVTAACPDSYNTGPLNAAAVVPVSGQQD